MEAQQICVDLFQSAPPAETRGDLSFDDINIADPVFQSAPPAETRGDVLVRVQSRFAQGFNPLPPPKRGETPQIDSFSALPTVSIRSPRRNEGRPSPG